MRTITSADAIIFQPLFREAQQSSYILEVSGLNPQTLQHVVSSCNVYLEQSRFTWRHDSILKTLAKYLSSIKKNSLIYADIESFDNPSIISGPDDRPNMIVLNNTKDKICVVEITVGFETNIAKNCKRNEIRYEDICSSLKQRFGNVKIY